MLKGRYELRERLGAGGMAKVFRAHDSVLDRIVAIKILHDDLSEAETIRARFLREARIVARLRHPHVVEIYDIIDLPSASGEHNTGMVMELIEGADLARAVEPCPQLSPELAILLVRQIGDALAFAHDQGIIHRDVKPANVLIDRSGRVKLSDFGIAKVTHGTQLTQTGGFLGTPAYIAPEVCRGEDSSPLSDEYALTALLYELLTGRLPFEGSNPLAVLTAIQNGRYPNPRELNPDVDARLESIVARGMAGDPTQRFADLPAFIEVISAHTPPLSADKERRICAKLLEDPAEASAMATMASGRPARAPTPPRPSKRVSGDAPSNPNLSITSMPKGEVAQPTRVTVPASTESRRSRASTIAIAAAIGGIAIGLAVAPLTAGRDGTPSEPEPSTTAAATAIPTAPPPVRSPAPEPPAVPVAAPEPEPEPVAAAPDAPTPTPPEAAAPVVVKPVAAPTTRKRRASRTTARATRPPAPDPQPTRRDEDQPRPAPKPAAPPVPAEEPALPPPPATTSRPAADSSTPGKLVLRTAPWAEVFVAGKSRGRTPYLKDLSLPPGRHIVVLRNPGLPERQVAIDILSGQTVTRRIDLRKSP